jgi:CBS domain-containing membrane protein
MTPRPAGRVGEEGRSWRAIGRGFAARLAPLRAPVDARERWRAVVGAGLGILAMALIARWFVGTLQPGLPWLAAPLGASAVLVFAVPGSPLAQPWAVVGGNVGSALVGAACAQTIGDPVLAAAAAVPLAIALMFALRCLHPPGGATALLAATAPAGFGFAVFPMLVDSLLLVLAGMLYNELTGRRYPHAPARGASSEATTPAGRFSAADLDAALAHYNQVLDVSRGDLERLLQFAEAAAYERNFGHLTCADIMSTAPLSVQFGTGLDEAWALMRQHRIKALPVVDRTRRVVGIVTVSDFMRHVDLDARDGFGDRLRALIRRDGAMHSSKPEAVGQLMTRQVRVASASRPVAELVPLFSDDGHHHIPVIDEEKRLVGIITQSDLVRALHRFARVAA